MGKPVKILVTYDSFRHVREALGDQIRNFQVVVDEFQSIFIDARFKSDAELELLYQLQDLQKVCFVSATPMLDKYLDMLDVTITNCVLATAQTYVDAMKKENGFNAKAQTTAFNMTKDAVMQLLTEEAQKYLNSAVGDLELYISQKIEAEVKFNKSYNNV
jgi:hypothetical protein